MSDFRSKGRIRPPQKERSEIGKLLVSLRTEQGWTLQNAGEKSGISHRIIAKLEKGQLDTSILHLENYLNFYGFSLSAKLIEEKKFSQELNPTLDNKGLPKW